MNARRNLFAAVSVVIFLALSIDAQADQKGPTIEPFLGYTHISDVMQGRPFLVPMPGCEQTMDWMGAGGTFVWPHVEIDLAQGIKQQNAWCGRPYSKPRESGTLLTLRWYPWRK